LTTSSANLHANSSFCTTVTPPFTLRFYLCTLTYSKTNFSLRSCLLEWWFIMFIWNSLCPLDWQTLLYFWNAFFPWMTMRLCLEYNKTLPWVPASFYTWTTMNFLLLDWLHFFLLCIGAGIVVVYRVCFYVYWSRFFWCLGWDILLGITWWFYPLRLQSLLLLHGYFTHLKPHFATLFTWRFNHFVDCKSMRDNISFISWQSWNLHDNNFKYFSRQFNYVFQYLS
jgi:hypothetical protein